MTISVVAAAPLAKNLIQVTFSEPFTLDSLFYNRSNFAFTTRYGDIIDIYAKEIQPYSTSIAHVYLQDSTLEEGAYRVTVFGVSALADGIPIEQGAGPNYADFVGAGESLKSFDIRKRVQSWLNTRYASNLHALLCATGEMNDEFGGKKATSAVNEAYFAMCLRTATGEDLGVIAQNYGVTRPFFATTDPLFRSLIPIYGTLKKCILKIFYAALTVVFGDSILTGWRIYTVRPNELLLEVPADLYFGLSPTGLGSASYFHADATVFSPPSYPGDYFVADASVSGTTVGGNILILFQSVDLTELVDELKAAGIQLVVDII